MLVARVSSRSPRAARPASRRCRRWRLTDSSRSSA